jgi:hypothetical protein
MGVPPRKGGNVMVRLGSGRLALTQRYDEEYL